MSTILVTGATGTVGATVVRELRRRGVAVRALVRDPARAASVLGTGVQIAAGDFADPASIRGALDGVDRVLLCTSNHPRQAEHETTVIDAAAAARVRRLVKVSAIGARRGSPLAFWDAHAQVEQHLHASGLPAVVLQPSFYLSNLLAAAATVAQAGQVFAPAGDAKIAMVDPRDVAAVAAVALTEDGHAGRVYALTGPAAVTYVDVAEQLSAATGRTVRYVEVPDEAARARMIEAGLSLWLAEQLVTLWSLLRQGAASTTTDVVRVLTGSEPRSVADFARDHAAAFLR